MSKYYDEEKVKTLKSQNLTVFEDIHQAKLELVNGCNLTCDFCGISRVKMGKMTKETFLNAINGLPDTLKRMEFILHGEPILNENIYEFTRMTRNRFPRVQITVLSNMEKIKKDGFQQILDLYDSGMNCIQADLYKEDTEKWFLETLAEFKDELSKRDIVVKDYYKDRINPFHYRGPKKKYLIYVSDSSERNHGKTCTRDFHNFGGNLPHKRWTPYTEQTLKDFPVNIVCVEPLKYLSVTWNGNVTLCCRDGGRSVVVGNINEESATDIWRGENMQVLRYVLSLGRRDMLLPCMLCPTRSFRFGLYPFWGNAPSQEKIKEVLSKVQFLYCKEPLFSNLKDFYDIPGKKEEYPFLSSHVEKGGIQ